jgi:hypothetical protein
MLVGLTFKNNDTEQVKTKIGKVSSSLQRMINSYFFSDKVGILKGYANECSIFNQVVGTLGKTTITFNKGALSIYGGVVLIEQGTTLEIPNVANGSIGVYVDLSQEAGKEVSFYAGANPPTDADNLQDNEITGKYYFELYEYSVSGTTFTITSKTDKFIVENEDFTSGETAVAKANKIVPSETTNNSVSFYLGENIVRLEW